MDMNELQIVGQLVIALAVLLAAVALAVRLSTKSREVAFEAERKARQELIDELRRDLSKERDDHIKTQNRVRELEREHEIDVQERETYQNEMKDMRAQIGTLLIEMGALRSEVIVLKTERDDQETENKALKSKNETLTAESARLFRANELLLAQIQAYENTLALLHAGHKNVDPDSIPNRPKTPPELRPMLEASEKTDHEVVKEVRADYRRRKTDELRSLAGGEKDTAADNAAGGE